ncbi:Hypothetical protein FKW44_023046 [Caligus rogercresseyi]|uniref:Uncharacterized protein n=1 Tax=Caligus rogercresseyi TaxID=217165 RepID=A0A7T8GP85_CALRO|nr:Hypothetical protein FKW44_023046 [Caligus rogercresseyi]
MTWQGASPVAGDGTTFGSRISLVLKNSLPRGDNRHGCGSRDLEVLPLQRWGCGARNPIGDLVFPTPKRPTRSTTSVACPFDRHICVPRSVCVEQF